MSLNKIKSLRLQRSSQRSESAKSTADTPMVVVEEEKNHVETIDISSRNESLTPLHSTPKRSSMNQSVSHDQSGIEHRVSPILLPCTQDGGSEVAWDWQSPLAKSSTLKRNRNNPEPIGTPKRTTTLLQKKRNSNSPLLYKPIKRKLMRNNLQQDDVDKFTAEMRALSEQIKTMPKDDKAHESDDDLIIQIDIADFIESDDNDSHKNGKSVAKTSLDELFDDSADDYMVKCSQEVEEKLRLESCRETSSKRISANSTSVKDSSSSWHQNSYSRIVAAREKTGEDPRNSSSKLENSSRKSFSRMSSLSSNITSEAKQTCSSSTNNNNVLKPGKSTDSSKVSTQNEVFSIPDDSFDDFIAVCDFESSAQIDATTSRYGKVYESPHSDNSRKSGDTKLLPPPSQTTVSKNTTKLFPRSASNDSIGNSSTKTISTINKDKKFFKTKSLSSSSFDEQQASISSNGNTSLTARGWKSSLFSNGKASKIVSTGKIRVEGDNGAWPKSNGNEAKSGMSDFNRSEPKGDANSGKMRYNNGTGDTRRTGTATGSQPSTQICTPAEIERKRLEAKMKLEAKRKLLARSKSACVLSGDISKRPVIKR